MTLVDLLADSAIKICSILDIHEAQIKSYEEWIHDYNEWDNQLSLYVFSRYPLPCHRLVQSVSSHSKLGNPYLVFDAPSTSTPFPKQYREELGRMLLCGRGHGRLADEMHRLLRMLLWELIGAPEPIEEKGGSWE